MRRVWLAFLIFLPLAGIVHAAAVPTGGLETADGLFEKGLYQEALKAYEPALKPPGTETSLRALYRAAECSALLFRYADAWARASSAKLPEDPIWRARFLILRAELAREFLKQYGFAAPRDAEEGTADQTRRTPDEWHADIRAAYRGLWGLRERLVLVPLRAESYFVDLKDADAAGTPSLWDFAVLRWSQYLLDEAPASPGNNPASRDFLGKDYQGKWSQEAPAASQAAAIFEDAARLPGEGRESARGLWRIRRVLIPSEHPGRVLPGEDPTEAARAAIDTLKAWMESWEPPGAKARAGLEAAKLLSRQGSYPEAIRLCKSVEAPFQGWTRASTSSGSSGLRAAKRCAKIRAEIELPVLNLTARFAPPPGKGALRLNTRNLAAVHFRLYRTTPEELEARPGRRPPQDWSAVRSADKDLVAEFAGRTPDHAWTADIRGHMPYAYTDTTVETPELRPALYLAIASSDKAFKPGSSLMAAGVLNVTELFLIASSGPKGPERDFVFDPAGPRDREAEGFHLYAIDAKSGKPRAAHVEAYRRDHWREARRVSLDLDEDGTGGATVVVRLDHTQGTNASLDPLASFGGSYAYGANPVYFGFAPPAPVQVFVETDRPIYRPGQEVRVKVTVLRRTPRGYKVYDGSSTVRLSVHDANGQDLFKEELRLSAMGSAAARVTIPTGRLLGTYGADATLSEFQSMFYGSAHFAVEEYKRPEFEVTVKEATGPWKYGSPATVSGEARYYFGGAVPDAPVSYHVYRESWAPWFCWWWRGLIPSGRTEVASGAARTDASGDFSFAFTPLPADPSQKEPWPSQFRVEAEARDPGGRTITGSRTFKAGSKAFLFDIAPPAGFFTAGKSAGVPVRLMNLDEKPVAGEGSFELHRLEGSPKAPEAESQWGGYFPESPSLESLYREIPDGSKVAEGKLAFQGEKAAEAALGALAEGAYRMTVRAEDPWGGETEQSIVLLVADEKGRTSLPLPAVAIPEHATALSGETARILLGSALLKGALYVEVWGGPFLLERRKVDAGGVRVLSVPVGEDHKGGFTVRWFGAGDFRIRSGQAHVDVPWKDRELTLKLRHDKALKPGQQASWALSVLGPGGKPVSGEATVRVFDRSLEYYARAMAPWVSSLYAARGAPPGAQGSVFQPYVHHIPVEEGWIKKMLDLYREAIAEPSQPMLRLNKSRVYGYGLAGGRAKHRVPGGFGPAAAGPMALERGMAQREEAADKSADELKAKKVEGPRGEPPVKARTEFAETAYFEPQLAVLNGRGAVRFKAPEQLTGWKIQASVLTQDVKRGTLSAETVTRKDLMVRVEVPRFYREGDKGVIKAVVHNETDKELSGEVALSVSEDGKDITEKLHIRQLVRSFSVIPRGISALTWELEIPRGSLTTLKVRAVVRSGELVDAEERDLPVLPSRERLIETALISLDGTVKRTLSLAAFKEEDPTRQNESMHLQIDPQLALSILNTLPFLVHYPHECTEQLLHRYVPLAITNAFYRKDPRVAAAVRKIPKRDTLTPAWDRSDPRRLMALMESPWEELSKGRKSYWPVVDMLDPAVVKAELSDALGKLRAYQNPDGAYPWFPGGRSDPYMTLLVLSGFAEAQRYGVEVPMDSVRRALGYVNGEVPKHLKPEPGELSLILYGAYVVTSFPRSLPEAAQGFRFAKAWADYADKHAEAMTPMGKALAAHAYWRLGEKAKGDLYLGRAMDGAREDPVAGVYWTPEKISWLWYNDSVEKHAFLLRTLLAIRPKDPRIPGMVQWLLFNRKGNEWKSTKASAAAIYSLLDVLRSRGALDRGDRYTVRWGEDLQAAQVEPMDWLEKPLRWAKAGAEIGPRQGQAEITKEGPGLAFASLTWVYSTDKPAKASEPGMMELSRRFYLRKKEGEAYHLVPVKAGETVRVGDQIEVRLGVKTRSQFEYVHLKDPKFAGFEAEELRSGWKWDQLSRYEEPRDSLTNFFMDRLPHGEYVLRYRLRPTTPGSYRLGAAVLQSMYAPEMAAHSDGFTLNVIE